MKLKYKDIVIIIFLGGVLTYAACRRSNLLPLKGNPDQAGRVTTFHWQDTIDHGNFTIIADPGEGIKVRRHDGAMLAGHPGIKPEALHLEKGFIAGSDTLDLLFCLTGDKKSVPCFRIMEDGSLTGVEI